jgi:hypothetical protein
MPGGQPWPKDKNGRDWPQDRWGRPMRPLWDYPPGVRAPGEGVAPGEPGSVTTADAINAHLQAEAMLADPLGITHDIACRQPNNRLRNDASALGQNHPRSQLLTV